MRSANRREFAVCKRMRVSFIHLAGIRCFEDTGHLKLSPGCNIFVGQNNSGKSTILHAALALQSLGLKGEDVRRGSPDCFIQVGFADVQSTDKLNTRPAGGPSAFIAKNVFRGSAPTSSAAAIPFNDGHPVFSSSRPNHGIVPFLAKRKAPNYDQTVSLNAQGAVTGTYQHLIARIDTLATAGHPRHDSFMRAVREIVGLPITTKAAANGKQAGYYLDEDNFVSLERMGDGVTELVAHIVELVLEDGKLFVLEEPESFLHPRALKALLRLMREASTRNQLLIATHSNTVLRELSDARETRIFRVFRTSDSPSAPSAVEIVPATTDSHRELLRELGYDFADIGLHEAWLFLEESSAESIFREVLIPLFSPKLAGVLRTFSAAGASNLEPTVSEFTRLVCFIHLQPAYAGRTWIRADNDDAGQKAITGIRSNYSALGEDECRVFAEPNFEAYYPSSFSSKVTEVLAIKDKNQKRNAKAALVREVIDWTRENGTVARDEWASSAIEPIKLLHKIHGALGH